MAATPAAPAVRHEAAFSRLTPPRASTGIFARQASRKAARPAGWVPGACLFPNTGAKTAKSAASDSARKISAGGGEGGGGGGGGATGWGARARAWVLRG